MHNYWEEKYLENWKSSKLLERIKMKKISLHSAINKLKGVFMSGKRSVKGDISNKKYQMSQENILNMNVKVVREQWESIKKMPKMQTLVYMRI